MKRLFVCRFHWDFKNRCIICVYTICVATVATAASRSVCHFCNLIKATHKIMQDRLILLNTLQREKKNKFKIRVIFSKPNHNQKQNLNDFFLSANAQTFFLGWFITAPKLKSAHVLLPTIGRLSLKCSNDCLNPYQVELYGTVEHFDYFQKWCRKDVFDC